MAELNDKLITYGNLSTFQNNLINDASTSDKATWSSEKIASEIQQGGGGGGSVTIENITYAQLKAKRDNGQLVKGQQYRITDYVTTTAQANTQSAGHQFDIIVVADSEDKLNENARAIQHSGDTYFANCKLESWELKYCLDNDTNRFSWADTTNGKGDIYYMKDEWNNECPYDFKNIQFKRTVDNTDIYCYTFSFWYDDRDSRILDTTIFGNDGTLLDDGNGIVGVYGNIIRDYYVQLYNEKPLNLLTLSNNIFLAKESFDGGCFYGCFSNAFGINCYDNTIGDGCFYNAFGDNCFSNTLSDYCQYNILSKNCYNNIFGEGCRYNVLGNECIQIKFGNECKHNTFENWCYSLDFTINYSTSFGNSLQYITVLSTTSFAGSAVPSGIVLNVYYPQIVGKNSQDVFTVKNPLD